MDDGEARERVAAVEGLLDEVEQLADPAAREVATRLAQALLDLYGEGLARVVEEVAAVDDGTLAAALAGDELVAHLLLLHGLHPVALEDRVRGALEEVGPYLDSHGGGVELLGIDDDVVRLALRGSCSGCPSSTATLKLAIEDAIHKAAPDVAEVVAEGAVPEPAAPLLRIDVVAPRRSWSTAGGMPELRGGGAVLKQIAGEPVLFIALDERMVAYRPTCPGCGASLGSAVPAGRELACPGCGNRYDVRRAGRSLDAPELHLRPVPLLVDDAGMVKVAMGSAA
jgi:Fe-S cluster biogenesis protein NfuA/nitrite reductase/ring-hydroxylating ferredoxin subunit